MAQYYTPMSQNDRYSQYWAEKQKAMMQPQYQTSNVMGPPAPVEILSDPEGPGVVESGIANEADLTQNDWMKADKSAGVKALASGMQTEGGMEDKLGAGLTSYGIATANPYAVGAGLGLSTLSSINKGEMTNRQKRYEAEIQRINARQNAINSLAQISKGLKA